MKNLILYFFKFILKLKIDLKFRFTDKYIL
jgi:hypothetical protein